MLPIADKNPSKRHKVFLQFQKIHFLRSSRNPLKPHTIVPRPIHKNHTTTSHYTTGKNLSTSKNRNQQGKKLESVYEHIIGVGESIDQGALITVIRLMYKRRHYCDIRTLLITCSEIFSSLDKIRIGLMVKALYVRVLIILLVPFFLIIYLKKKQHYGMGNVFKCFLCYIKNFISK